MLGRIAVELLALAVTGFASEVRSPLSVHLIHSHGTTISASITNTDIVGYRVLHRNTVLDPDQSPGKLRVIGSKTIDVPFHGIRKHDCAHGRPDELAYTLVGPGQTLHREIDIAGLFDLEPDFYDVSAHSILPYILEEHSRPLAAGSSMKLASNVVSVPVNESQLRSTPQVHLRRHRKRTTIHNDCSSAQQQAITAANQACTKLADAAAEAALSGPAKPLQSYFKSASQSTRRKIANVYRAVATECNKTPGGTSTSHCTDPYNSCSGDLLAYTFWQGSGSSQVGTTYYCQRYFNDAILQASSDQCHEQSRATNTLHEMTHAVAGTSDLAYGIDGVMALSSEDAIVNADTYALFATDLNLGCIGGNAGPASSGAASSQSVPSSWASSPATSLSSSWNDWLTSMGFSN